MQLNLMRKVLVTHLPRSATLQSMHQAGNSSDLTIIITDPRVEMAAALMEANVSRKLSLSELARTVNLSPWRLCHLFKGQTGMAPIHYLRVLRMTLAKRLLETTYLSVKQVMSQVGINDESHFVRDFKTYHGLYPSELRRLSFDSRETSEAALSKNG
jgi:transcriptional regulator GlxA family with amidase domain